MSDKRKLATIAILVVVCVAGILIVAYASGYITGTEKIIALGFAAIVFVLISIYLASILKLRPKGVPIEDERTKMNGLHAAAYAFAGSMYFLVVSMVYDVLTSGSSNAQWLDLRTIELTILTNSALFLVMWIILGKRGFKD